MNPWWGGAFELLGEGDQGADIAVSVAGGRGQVDIVGGMVHDGRHLR